MCISILLKKCVEANPFAGNNSGPVDSPIVDLGYALYRPTSFNVGVERMLTPLLNAAC